MKNQLTTISDFRALHNLSTVKFARLRVKAERLNPGVKMASHHHEGIHNYNVLLRADLLEALLPPLKNVEDRVSLNDLYVKIAKLEAEMAKSSQSSEVVV